MSRRHNPWWSSLVPLLPVLQQLLPLLLLAVIGAHGAPTSSTSTSISAAAVEVQQVPTRGYDAVHVDENQSSFGGGGGGGGLRSFRHDDNDGDEYKDNEEEDQDHSIQLPLPKTNVVSPTSTGDSNTPTNNLRSFNDEQRQSRWLADASSSIDIQPRIVGGELSDRGEFPYFVDMFRCGGVLIAPDVVLSAAHCLSYNGLVVHVAGLEWTRATEGAIPAMVVDEVRHPNFDPITLDNDFYLHRLEQRVELDTDILLTLNDDGAVPSDGEIMVVMGMGYTSEDGGRSSRLQDVEVQSIPNEDCYGDRPDIVTDNMLCAGWDEGGRDACNGDSGGPLVLRTGNVHTLVGLVSMGNGCARPDAPGVYSRISRAFDWIRQVVCNEWAIEADLCREETPRPTAMPTRTPTETPASPPSPFPSEDSFSNLEDTDIAAKWNDTIPPGSSGPGFVISDMSDTRTDGSNGTDCVDILIGLQTDRWPQETTLSIVQYTFHDLSQDGARSNSSISTMLNVTDFDANSEYIWEQCIDWNSNHSCTIVNITDSVGDGLADTGYLLVTANGEDVYNDWNFGFGEVLALGKGCVNGIF